MLIQSNRSRTSSTLCSAIILNLPMLIAMNLWSKTRSLNQFITKNSQLSSVNTSQWSSASSSESIKSQYLQLLLQVKRNNLSKKSSRWCSTSFWSMGNDPKSLPKSFTCWHGSMSINVLCICQLLRKELTLNHHTATSSLRHSSSCLRLFKNMCIPDSKSEWTCLAQPIQNCLKTASMKSTSQATWSYLSSPQLSDKPTNTPTQDWSSECMQWLMVGWWSWSQDSPENLDLLIWQPIDQDSSLIKRVLKFFLRLLCFILKTLWTKDITSGRLVLLLKQSQS